MGSARQGSHQPLSRVAAAGRLRIRGERSALEHARLREAAGLVHGPVPVAFEVRAVQVEAVPGAVVRGGVARRGSVGADGSLRGCASGHEGGEYGGGERALSTLFLLVWRVAALPISARGGQGFLASLRARARPSALCCT